MRKWEGVNCGLVSVCVDVSHEELGLHKGIRFLFSQNKTIVNLTATSNFEHYSVDTNDDKNINDQLSTTDYEENDKTEDPIDPAKQSPSAAEQIETALFHLFLQCLWLQQNLHFFQVLKYLLVYHRFPHQGNNELLIQ